MMNLFAISGLLVGVTCFLLAVLPLYYGRNKIHWLLAQFNFIVACWGVGLFLIGISDSSDQAIKAWTIANYGGFLVAPSFYHFTCEFCSVRRPLLLKFAYGQALLFLVLSIFTDFIFNQTQIISNIYYVKPTVLYTVGLFMYGLFVILSFYELICHWK